MMLSASARAVTFAQTAEETCRPRNRIPDGVARIERLVGVLKTDLYSPRFTPSIDRAPRRQAPSRPAISGSRRLVKSGYAVCDSALALPDSANESGDLMRPRLE